MTDMPSVAFLGAGELRAVDNADLTASLISFAEPWLPVSVEITVDQASLPAFSVRIGAREYSIFAMSTALLEADLKVALQTAYGWRDAVTAVRRSSSHWVVSALSVGSTYKDSFQTARDVTAITAALISIVSADYVYWAAGDALSSPQSFADAAARMRSAGEMPIMSWIQLRLIPGAAQGIPGRFGLRTTGLDLFERPDVQLNPAFSTPQDAFKAGLDLAAYLLAEDTLVRNGDTIDLGSGNVFLAEEVERGGKSAITFNPISGVAA